MWSARWQNAYLQRIHHLCSAHSRVGHVHRNVVECCENARSYSLSFLLTGGTEEWGRGYGMGYVWMDGCEVPSVTLLTTCLWLSGRLSRFFVCTSQFKPHCFNIWMHYDLMKLSMGFCANIICARNIRSEPAYVVNYFMNYFMRPTRHFWDSSFAEILVLSCSLRLQIFDAFLCKGICNSRNLFWKGSTKS